MRKVAKGMLDILMASVNDVPVSTKKVKVSNIKVSKTASHTVPQL